MFLNQQLREPSVLATLTSRQYALIAVFAALLIVAGCGSSPPIREANASTARVAPAEESEAAEDLTATEAAVAGLTDGSAADTQPMTAQTAIRPDAPLNYTVKRGDTLWDIASVFLKDPWFWPEIWQINPQVENPHLIYPGDTLSLAYGAGGPEIRLTQFGDARLTPRLRSDPLDGPIDTIQFEQIAAFLSRPGVISKDEALRAPHILAFRDDHMMGGTGFEVYVKDLGGELNSRYTVVHVGDPIRDIGNNDILGYQAVYCATAVVNSPGEISKAMLIDGAREAVQGDRLIEPGTGALNFTPAFPKTSIDGQIISVMDGVTQIGPYQVVIVNRGADHGVIAGNVLAVDQAGAVVKNEHGKHPWKTKAFASSIRLPSERAGTILVFKVFDRISYALVIGARNHMRVADYVRNP